MNHIPSLFQFFLPLPFSYTRDRRKDKNREDEKGNKMTQKPLGRKN